MTSPKILPTLQLTEIQVNRSHRTAPECRGFEGWMKSSNCLEARLLADSSSITSMSTELVVFNQQNAEREGDLIPQSASSFQVLYQ